MSAPWCDLLGALSQRRGGLKWELIDALHTGRVRRRRKGPNHGRGARGKLKDIVSVSERLAEGEARAAPPCSVLEGCVRGLER